MRNTTGTANVAGGPYLHGTRHQLQPGNALHTDVINSGEGEEDDRQMCFATTVLETAVRWAFQRGISHGGDTLYVYEVELNDPEADVNYQSLGADGAATSVMAPAGRVVRLVYSVPEADYAPIFYAPRTSDARPGR